jgi:hypothetical protein
MTTNVFVESHYMFRPDLDATRTRILLLNHYTIFYNSLTRLRKRNS